MLIPERNCLTPVFHVGRQLSCPFIRLWPTTVATTAEDKTTGVSFTKTEVGHSTWCWKGLKERFLAKGIFAAKQLPVGGTVAVTEGGQSPCRAADVVPLPTNSVCRSPEAHPEVRRGRRA